MTPVPRTPVPMTPAAITPEQLLAEADRMLTAPGGTASWSRACVLLIRLALERALDQYWTAVLPEALRSPMRAQLLVLGHYASEQAAAHASQAWLGLSRAAHHHAYELAPTAAELRGWLTLVRQLIAELERN